MPKTVVSQDNAARVNDNANLIWGAAERLRGKIKPADYGKIILPFTVLRRMDCLLEPQLEKIKALATTLAKATDEARDRILFSKTGMAFYGLSEYSLSALLADPENISDNLKAYVNGLSKNMREVFIEHFDFFNWINRLDKQDLLYALVKFFADKDLHPEAVSTLEMGYLFENLIRKFNEASNATAGDHFTPREVIRLMTSLLFAKDGDKLAAEASVIDILDPACGTGGMLATANDYLRQSNANLRVNLYGQEINPESFGICRSDMLITGHSPDNIRLGNTLTRDCFPEKTFTYALSNPPYGVDYSEEYDAVKVEHDNGIDGRFAPGIPRKSDGQLLFLLHMLSKLPKDRPGRIAVIMNGSPLFNGDAGGGESEIRRHLMEHDLVDAIIALPTDLFYNTGIATYVWLVSNRKAAEDRGRVRLIDASARWQPMHKSLGSKRRELGDEHIREIVNLYLGFDRDDTIKIFTPQDFGYRKIYIERPLRLDVDLAETELGRFRNSSEHDDACLWMQTEFGTDVDSRLDDSSLCDAVAAHLEELSGLALLRTDEAAGKADIVNLEKQCAKRLRLLLNRDEWQTRKSLIQLLSHLREQGQSAWMDYNQFLDSINAQARTSGVQLRAAHINTIRAWVTRTHPDAERVIDRVITKDQSLGERFGHFNHDGKIVTFERNSDLADTERVPLNTDDNPRQRILDYFEAEVLPHVADAWINPAKTDVRDGEIGLVGYEINFNRYFYTYSPPRSLAEIDAELKAVEAKIAAMLAEVAE